MNWARIWTMMKMSWRLKWSQLIGCSVNLKKFTVQKTSGSVNFVMELSRSMAAIIASQNLRLTLNFEQHIHKYSLIY
jgi:hypothetical protein